MKAVLFILGISLACIGLAGIIAYYEPAPDVAQAAPAFTRTVAPTAEPTATPAPVYTATHNAPATVAAINLAAAAENARAAQVAADAIRYQANADLTRQAAEAEAAAVRAAKSEAGQNYRAELALTQTAADTARAQAEADVIRAQAEAARVEVDAQNRLVGGVVMVAGLAFVAWFLSLLWKSRKSPEIEQDDDLQEEAEPEPRPVSDFIAGVKWSLLGVSYPELVNVAGAFTDGRPLSDFQIVRTLGLMTEGQFAAFQDALIERSLAEWKNVDHHKQGVRLTAKGQAFFAELVGAPTPPPAPLTPIAPISGANDTIRAPEGYSPVGEEAQ